MMSSDWHVTFCIVDNQQSAVAEMHAQHAVMLEACLAHPALALR